MIPSVSPTTLRRSPTKRGVSLAPSEEYATSPNADSSGVMLRVNTSKLTKYFTKRGGKTLPESFTTEVIPPDVIEVKQPDGTWRLLSNTPNPLASGSKAGEGASKVIEMTKEQLKGMYHRDFPKGTIIKIGKYRVFINGLKTYAESDSNPMIPLTESTMPQYIKDIVF